MKTSAAIEEYVTYRRALGFAIRCEAYRLDAFRRHVGDAELDAIQADEVRGFLEGKLKTVSTVWYDKYNALAGFFKYACSRRYMSRSLLPTVLPKRPGRKNAFLYSIEQVRNILRVPDTAYHPNRLIEPRTMRAIVVVLYGTGLRPGEALRLARSDVDLGEALLTVRQTKFFKSRLVPFGSEVQQVLTDYDHGRLTGQVAGAPFFCSRKQEALKLDSVDNLFEWLRAEAGVLRFDGSRLQPRLYDFRHTFAVTRLVTWYREGRDVQRLLPHLATYLGHVHLDDTAYYLTITNELMKEASNCFERYALREVGRA